MVVRLREWSAYGVIALAALVVYDNSYSGPFVFDDLYAVVNNPTIRKLWPMGEVITPLASGDTVGGRPVLNLTFALNYAMGGLAVGGYHIANVGIHILAAFALFGFMRRTLGRPGLAERFGADAWGLALAIAVLWVVHPLQTESVTYVAQRAESLAGLFYLLTLYCFVRGVEGERGAGWRWAAVLACVVGMGCKETMVSAPLAVWLYDRTFVAGSFREALRRRWTMYLAMAASWLLLAYFIRASGGRGGSAGLASAATTLGYAQTQGYAIAKYLWLTVWPHPLVFDYGTPIITDPIKVLGPMVLLLLLAAATVVGVYRRTLLGFLGCWFFMVLAPSSSVVVVVTQTMAEHRMYLPLAAVMGLFVLTMYQWIGRKSLVLCAVAAVVWGWLTVSRNNDYQSEYAIWSDTVRKCPTNARALGNLGICYLKARQFENARLVEEESIRLKPDIAESHLTLGAVYFANGQEERGVAEYRKAVKINPRNVAMQTCLGAALSQMGEWRDAQYHLQEVLRLDPGNQVAEKLLGDVLMAREKEQR